MPREVLCPFFPFTQKKLDNHSKWAYKRIKSGLPKVVALLFQTQQQGCKVVGREV